ncbi:unnamed protein product [Rotaria sordida]|uniref:t-SNARE coiled-coil homology domain-containing protein n=1 Tax=Rotaria sordida TaxID=392033 RepID=A0A813U7A6_9BILA|nr:unnamed protein product [Rotaria sordida]
MTIDIIANKADFQRHLNGCERRLNDLTKSLQIIENLSQNLLQNTNNQEKQELYFNQLNDIISQIKFLYSSILKLEQCSYSFYGKKRLNFLKINLEKNQIKFEQIQKYSQTKFGYEYKENDIQQYNNEQQEQLIKLINKNFNDKQIELDYIHQHNILVNHIEKDLTDLNDTFHDLHRIVHEQGTMVNNIELSLTNTDNMIYEATENVKTTVQIKKRTKHIKWILIIILIIAFLLLIIIIYFSIKLSSPLR